MDVSFVKWLATDAGMDASEITAFCSPRVDPVSFEALFKQRLEIAFLSGALLYDGSDSHNETAGRLSADQIADRKHVLACIASNK